MRLLLRALSTGFPPIRAFLPTVLLSMFFFPLYSQSVLSQHNDLHRTGWNAAETKLTQANVSGGTFGKVFSQDVDDQVYAQPLIVNGISIGGGTHNIVIVATVSNTVYAFDADDGTRRTAYWSRSLTYPGYRPISHHEVGRACGVDNYKDFTGNIGIVGTPVIDPATNTLYVVARSTDGTTFVQYLHAINLANGSERVPAVSIHPTIPGNGDGSDGTTLPFDPKTENQRPGLLLYKGVVYVSWASHCDTGPYHGWMVGYDAGNLAQKYVYNSSPGGSAAGIWMSGQAPAVDDAGFLYITTGNGTVGGQTGVNDVTNRGESLVKLSQDLKVQDFFTPDDYQDLNNGDLDYGCDGVLLIPNTNLSLSGSKESWLYLVNTTNMGKTTGTFLQTLDVNVSFSGDKHVHGTPAYYKDDKGKEYIYAWAEDGLLKQFPFLRAQGKFDPDNKILGNTVLPYGMPGALLSVSSNGATAGTGILWASHPINGDANQNDVPGVLQAFDATNVSRELWNSNMSGRRDGVGTLAKFVPPTIANGKVYVATFSKELLVYGLNAPKASACPNALPSPWKSADIGYVNVAGDACYNKGGFTITATGDDINNSEDAFHGVFQSVKGNKMTMIARVVSISNTNQALAKAGVMFRGSLDPGAPNIFMTLTQGGDYLMQNRTTQSATTNPQVGNRYAGSYWVKVTANGNQFNGYVSPDGSNWTSVGTVTQALGSTVYAGLAYSSHNNSASGLGTAVFDNVSFASDATTPLPVTLIAFTGTNVDNQYGILNWSTSQEVNFDHFDIERSLSATDFQPVGSVAGRGVTGSPAAYSFKDESPVDGTNYYRLKMVDNDGRFSYSDIIAVSFDLTAMEVYPNPATDHITVRTNRNFTQGQPLHFELISLLGQHLPTSVQPGDQAEKITLRLPAGIANGSYYLTAVNGAGKKQSWKIQVRN